MIIKAPGAAVAELPFVLWDNVLARAPLVVGGGDVAGAPNVLGPQTYDRWEPTAIQSNVTVVLPEAATCDCMAISGQNLAGTGGGARVLYSVDGVTSWTALTGVFPTDGGAAAVIFPATSALGWRLQLYGGVVGKTLSIGMIGRRLEFPAPVLADYTPATFADQSDLAGLVSLGGHFLGAAEYRRSLELEAAFAPLPRAFVEGAEFRAFRAHYNAGGTFFFGASPDALPDDLAYYWRRDGAADLRPSYRGGGLVSLKMEMAGYAG